MQLTTEQKSIVAGWVAAGDGLSDIQKKVANEFKISLTYMEIRFLVDDLGVTLKDKAVKPVKTPAVAPSKAAAPEPEPGHPEDEEADDFGPEESAGPANVRVELDLVTKLGAIVSGTVVFSDGVKASWMLDQQGRLALTAGKEGYRPGPADIRAFQVELSRQLKAKGF